MNITPLKINLKKDHHLEITWSDGRVDVFPIDYLRRMCPCATCKEIRREKTARKSLLAVLPGNSSASKPLQAMEASLVGNYAMRINWSDNHDSGIYSFEYLRRIGPASLNV